MRAFRSVTGGGVGSAAPGPTGPVPSDPPSVPRVGFPPCSEPGPGGAAACVRYVSPATPPPRQTTTTSTAVATLSLVINMAFNTPSVSAVTVGVTAPSTVPPAAWIVDAITPAGTLAAAAL